MANSQYSWRKDQYKSIVPPLYLGSAYGFESAEEGAAIFSGTKKGYAYTRLGNPTVTAFEEWLTVAEHGEKTFATNTGLSALLLGVLTLTKKKKQVVTSPYIYGGSYHLSHLLNSWGGARITFVENAFNNKAWENAITKETAFVFLESPSNPSVDIFDIKAIADIAHKKGTVLIVDNTIATPALQKPLELGADAVLHSVTKYLTRQSTGLGGALVGSKKFVTQYGDELYDWFIHGGFVMHPLSAWFALQNSYTLINDMKTFSKNALAVANILTKNKGVGNVHYPHLHGNRNYKLARHQMQNGGSGLLAFELENFSAAKKFVNALRHVIIAPHLGDVRSLIIHPASTTHNRLSKEERAKVHISDGLVRCSVGLGEIQETIADIEQALRVL